MAHIVGVEFTAGVPAAGALTTARDSGKLRKRRVRLCLLRMLWRKPLAMTWRFLLISVALQAGGCVSLPVASVRESHALQDTVDTKLGHYAADFESAHDGEDAFYLLDNGLDAFVARAELIQLSERSLDLQYYLYHDDLVGRLLTSMLLKAADRGVRIRLLLDDMDLAGRGGKIVALDSHPNIEVRIFNPFSRRFFRAPQFITGLGTLTRRMHNKSFVADNAVAVVGGRNIGDEYFDADPVLEFADLDVMVAGDTARRVSDAFDLYWNHELAKPVASVIHARPGAQRIRAITEEMMSFTNEQRTSDYMRALADARLARQIRDNSVQYLPGKATVVFDHPDKIVRPRDAHGLQLLSQLASVLENVQHDVVVISPYFVPGREGVRFFSKLAARGVRVRILTNSLASNDVGMVHAGYVKYRKALLKNGVEIYELNKIREGKKRKIGRSSAASLHAKTFILDNKQIFIGSLNLDPRSVFENTEIGLVIDSPETASAIARSFEQKILVHAYRVTLESVDGGRQHLVWRGIENGQPVVFTRDPHTSIWERLGINILRLLPIESQL